MKYKLPILFQLIYIILGAVRFATKHFEHDRHMLVFR